LKGSFAKTLTIPPAVIPLAYLEVLQRRILTTALTKEQEKNEVGKTKVYLITYPFASLFKNYCILYCILLYLLV